MNIEINENFRVIKDGKDIGFAPDVIVNYLSSIDPENASDSISYRVARALTEKHYEIIAAKDEDHRAKIAEKDARINALLNPHPDDDEAIEVAARARAAKMKTEKKIEERAHALAKE